jgi:hypothetical protein
MKIIKNIKFIVLRSIYLFIYMFNNIEYLCIIYVM